MQSNDEASQKELARIHLFLERVLTPARLAHSSGVMQVMGELAEVYGLDREKALVSGLLHDAAKDFSPAQQERWIREAGIPVEHPWDRDYGLYMHGPVGAFFIQKALGIDDPDVLEAVYKHTYYGQGVSESPLVWCLRFADILEPTRHWNDHAHWIRDGEPRLRQLVFSGDLRAAAFFQTGLLIRFYRENGAPIHPHMREIYKNYLAQPGFDESWFNSREEPPMRSTC